MFAAVVALFACFVGTQALVAVRGEDYVLETTGVTYAEHARSGFFQLLFVAAITLLALLWSAARLGRDDERLNRWFRVLAEVAVIGYRQGLEKLERSRKQPGGFRVTSATLFGLCSDEITPDG